MAIIISRVVQAQRSATRSGVEKTAVRVGVMLCMMAFLIFDYGNFISD